MVGAILSTYFNAHHGLGEKLAYFKTGSEIQREIFNQEQKGMQPSFVLFGGFVDKISKVLEPKLAFFPAKVQMES